MFPFAGVFLGRPSFPAFPGRSDPCEIDLALAEKVFQNLQEVETVLIGNIPPGSPRDGNRSWESGKAEKNSPIRKDGLVLLTSLGGLFGGFGVSRKTDGRIFSEVAGL